jgi:hypothetical protein
MKTKYSKIQSIVDALSVAVADAGLGVNKA